MPDLSPYSQGRVNNRTKLLTVVKVVIVTLLNEAASINNGTHLGKKKVISSISCYETFCSLYKQGEPCLLRKLKLDGSKALDKGSNPLLAGKYV